jgi:hypothetical protein
MNFLLKSVNLKPDGWLWYFPQYHVIMFGLVLIAIALMAVAVCLLAIFLSRLNVWIAQTVHTTCPCCHGETLVTIQKCASPQCRFVRILRDPTSAHGVAADREEPSLELSPQHTHGD